MSDDEGDGRGEDESRGGESQKVESPVADPFEKLTDSVGDRKGDPFDELDADAPHGDDGNDGTVHGQSDEPDDGWHPPGGPEGDDWSPASSIDTDLDGSQVDREATGGDGDATAGTGESETGHSEGHTGDPFESPDSAFQRMDVGDVDPDPVWEELSAAEARGSVADARKQTYAEVSKHRYCEQCEYFTGPPKVSCTHEGTEILEFLDMERVRLVDCPVVAERRELEDGE